MVCRGMDHAARALLSPHPGSCMAFRRSRRQAPRQWSAALVLSFPTQKAGIVSRVPFFADGPRFGLSDAMGDVGALSGAWLSAIRPLGVLPPPGPVKHVVGLFHELVPRCGLSALSQ